MPANPMGEVLLSLRKTMLQREEGDAQLLADYCTRQDGAALASLVKRHAPMVWGVCRRVLGNHHDVEDAFQATFLVFVRKAASIRNKDLLANWLYGVARQTALKARTTTARRNERERQVMNMPEAAAKQEKLVNDLQPLLDQELGLLPEKYRAVIVLCDLQGKTRHEAARCLGCAEGTVASRLARARTMLAKRLARHGLPVSGGVVAVLLAPQAASASVPSSVVNFTISSAKLFAAGQTAGAISPKVVALAEGALKTMLLKKLTSVIVATILLLGLTASAWVMGQTGTETEARPENAIVPQRKEQGGQKDEKEMDQKAIEADLEKLDGMWRLVALERGGNPVDPETWGRNVRLEFSGSTVHHYSGKRVTKGEIRIDPSKTPKWIDQNLENGAQGHGIYELKGDKLRIFVVTTKDDAGNIVRAERPTEFKTRDRTTEAIATYERVNAAVENGLSVSLVAAKQQFLEGEALRFHATFKNVSDQDFRLFDPVWYRYWELTIASGPWRAVSLNKGIRQPVVLVLKPGQELAVDVPIDDTFAYHWGGVQHRPVPPRKHLQPGKYKLHAAIKFIKNETLGAPFWTGTIRTPPAAFEIVADPVSALPPPMAWGKETNGLAANLRAFKTVVKPGDAMEFVVLVKNVSREEIISLLGVNGKLSHFPWRFHFGDWEWSTPGPSLMAVHLKPGDTASVRCLVATTRDSLSAEQKGRHFAALPFRNVKTGEKSTRLPEGVYRVQAATIAPGRDTFVETNVIEVRVSDDRNDTAPTPSTAGELGIAPADDASISMVEWPPVISPNAGMRIVRFAVQPGGKFRFGKTTGTLPREEINKLREQIEKADIGIVSVDDGPTITLRWRDETGKQQEKVFTYLEAPDLKKLVAKLEELAAKYGGQ